MSKKRREAMARPETAAPETENTGRTKPESPQPDRWWNLSAARRWPAVAIAAFLLLGVFGAGLKYLEESKSQQKATTETQPAVLNPAPYAPPPETQTNLHVAKDYVYSGSRLVAIEEPGSTMKPPADLAVWRPSSGVWYVMGGDGLIQAAAAWGMQNDVPIPADYDGDSKTDFAIYRPSTSAGQSAYWYILKSSDSSFNAYPFGTLSDIPVPSDYDGDGQAETAIWRPSNGAWHIISTSASNYYVQQFGSLNDKPVPADYDGDGKSDLAVWRKDFTTWYVWLTATNTWWVEQFGNATDTVVTGDYDGDGKFDLAMWQQDNVWKMKQSGSGIVRSLSWGLASSDKAVPGDYDADGKTDVAIWRPSTGGWWIEQSASSYSLRYAQWGMNGDIPVPAPYRR